MSKATRRDLALSIRAGMVLKTHLARARMGLRGADDRRAFALQRELAGFLSALKGIKGRVGKPEVQMRLERAA